MQIIEEAGYGMRSEDTSTIVAIVLAFCGVYWYFGMTKTVTVTAPVIAAAPVAKGGMQLPFEEVARLSRPAILLANYERLEHMDVSRDAGLTKGIKLSQSGNRNAGIAVKPDDSGFYVGTETALLQFDSQAELIKRIPLTEFNLGGAEFIWGATMSDTRIWLTSIGGPTGLAIIEWQLDKPPATRLVVPVTHAVHIAVVRETRKVYIPFAGGLVDFEKAKFEQASWGKTGEYYFADFDSARGLLLSTLPQSMTRKIVRVNLLTGGQQFVTEGSYAVWGPDDWVFFCVGDTELWRCKSDGSKREVVFTATEDKIVSAAGFAVAPRFDRSRSRLAYSYYSTAGSGEPVYSAAAAAKAVSGIVLIDLETQEYRLLHDKFRINLAWLVNDGQATSRPLSP